MDENIIKFYEILLNEDQLKKNKIIVDVKILLSHFVVVVVGVIFVAKK